ncbi:acetamidase/formamidase family protein [Phytohabitans rumicis]|uniref:Acetamidase n=1 Tax=Phytohabitans rumicis TaxID=1076125 RepID=A0A6V8L9R7_9ACTN|nr:acetamidase/formamidase family protein [Phytohabitans rumicis]GFJ93064.1 acetamidase [Phytohabitans rumicis]
MHVLEPDARTLHGYFSPDYPPVLTVEPGDTVRFSTLDCWWSAGPYTGGGIQNRPRAEHYRAGYGHALVGPIAVRGARPGMVLEVRVDAVVPATWGTCVAGGWPSAFNERYGELGETAVHTWELDPEAMTGRNQHGHGVTLRPFLGVMGMPPAEPGEHSTIPPRRHGGNLDCRDLVAGSTLYLPVPVEGALFSAGDGHAKQGDGEVSGTAIECPMDRVELTFGLRDDWALTGPVARTAAGWLTMGLGPTLDDATYEALEAMFALLGRLHGVSRRDAIALASVAVDVRVTQIVNQTVGVHAVLPHDALHTA